MFTLEQIRNAHSKVKSGADFPKYIQDIRQLGVSAYETYVTDGHTRFLTKDNNELVSPPKYDPLIISENSDNVQFQKALKEHQQGKTDYPTFCGSCAKLGVDKWIVDISRMTCTYYDKSGNAMLVEIIPSV